MESCNVKIILIFFCILVFTSCKNSESEGNYSFDSSIFENGDIICRLGDGMFSNLFKNYSVNEKLYSHTGVVYIENDSIYVIHAEASELTGIGFVKKEKLSSFLSNIHTWGIYRLNTQASVKEKITCAALQYFDKKTPFDMNFDLSNDDKVYCTQLVANSINRGIGYKLITPGVEFNKRPFYTVDDIYFRPEFDNIYKTSKN